MAGPRPQGAQRAGLLVAPPRRIRSVKMVLAGIVCLVTVSWIFLLSGAGKRMDIDGGEMMLMPPPSWSIDYAAITQLTQSSIFVAAWLSRCKRSRRT